MAKRTYRSAAGQSVDLGALQLKNEQEPAIGNMRVNARGDELTPDGRIAKRREDAVQDNYYKLHTMIPQDDVIPEAETPVKNSIVADPLMDLVNEEIFEPVEEKEAVVSAEEPSLSASTAQAQSKRSTEVKSTRQQRRSISGVKRV